MKRIGLIGCGVVGQTLGARLLHASFELSVYDRHPERVAPLIERGAVAAESLLALAAGRDALVTALPRAEDVREALLAPGGAWTAAESGLLHVDTSTIGVACARVLAAEAGKRRIRYLDAPLSAAGTEDSQPRLALFVGGNADHYALALPLLRSLADRIHFFGGPPGKGQVAKLVNNLTSHGLTVLLGEALAMGLKAGLPIELLRASLHDGTAQCRVLDELLPASAFGGDWRPGLRLDLALKDLSLAQELSEETGVEQHLIAQLRSIYERARERGFGQLSSHAVLRLVEEAANVSFRSSIFERLPATTAEEDAPD